MDNFVKTPKKKFERNNPKKQGFDFESLKVCPVCGGKRVRTCRCMRADSTCENGHNWHLCTVHMKIVIGHSDHGKSGCSCGEGE